MSCFQEADFEIVKGTDLDLNILVQDANDDPINISGASEFEFRAKERLGSPTPVINLTLGTHPSQFTVTSGPGGAFTIRIAAADTSGLDAGSYLYAIYVTTPDIGRRQIVTPATMTIIEAL